MSSVQDLESYPPDRSLRGFSSSVVWVAAGLIVALAFVGLYRGVSGVRPQGFVDPRHKGGSPDAMLAVPLAHDDQWSTLNGPQVLPPEAPKPLKMAAKKADAEVAGSSEAAANADAPVTGTTPDSRAADKAPSDQTADPR